jgi:hypothetical protein
MGIQENCKLLTLRGQVHVSGQYAKVVATRVSRKMDQTPNFTQRKGGMSMFSANTQRPSQYV